MVSAALLDWPLVELESGCEVELDEVVAVAAGVEVVVFVVALRSRSRSVVVCGSGEPANVTAPSASANDASVAAATRRWMRALRSCVGWRACRHRARRS